MLFNCLSTTLLLLCCSLFRLPVDLLVSRRLLCIKTFLIGNLVLGGDIVTGVTLLVVSLLLLVTVWFERTFVTFFCNPKSRNVAVLGSRSI